MERERWLRPESEEEKESEPRNRWELSAFEKIDLENLIIQKLKEFPKLDELGGEPMLREILTSQLVERRELMKDVRRREEKERRRAAERSREKLKHIASKVFGLSMGLGGASALTVSAMYPEKVQAVSEAFNPYHVSDLPSSAAAGSESRERRDETHVDLEAMDPQATPERMRRLLGALPKGWVRDIGSMTYEDRTGDQVKNMKAGIFAAAIAKESGAAHEPTDIIFYKGSKLASRAIALGDFVPHEIAHGNDWRFDGEMTEDQRSRLHASILQRIYEPDRFKSAYVDGIKVSETEQRALEYWAEISAAYMQADILKFSGLAPRDVEIIEWQIRLTDPDFDRDVAVQEFKAVLREMRWSEIWPDVREQLGARQVADEDIDEFEDWADVRLESWRGTPLYDRGQMENLTAKVSDWATDEERRVYVETLMAVYTQREALLSDLLATDKPSEELDAAFSTYARVTGNLREFGADSFGDDGLRFTREVRQMIEEEGMIIGNYSQGVKFFHDQLTMQRLDDLAMRKSGATEPWAMKAMGWKDDESQPL